MPSGPTACRSSRWKTCSKLYVQTRNSLYEITVIERWTGAILVRGGQLFPELTPAQLAGATLWGSFLKMRGIYVGFAMEINASEQRYLTTRVREIAVETADAHDELLFC
jgi:hypothetical protein